MSTDRQLCAGRWAASLHGSFKFLEALVQGMDNKAIAQLLFISYYTALPHRHALLVTLKERIASPGRDICHSQRHRIS